MKLAATYSPFLDHNVSDPFVFRGDMSFAFDCCAKSKFEGLELSLCDPDDIDAKELNNYIKKYNVEIVAISTDQIYERWGLCFSSSCEESRNAAHVYIDKLIDMASEYHAPVIIDKMIGRPEPDCNISEKVRVDQIHFHMTEALSYAAKKGVKILLSANNILGMSVEETANYIKSFKSHHIKMSINTCKMAAAKESIYDVIKNNSDLIEYIQLCDTNQKAAGLGKLGFAQVFKALDMINYDGCLCAAVSPIPSPEKALNATMLTFVRNSVMMYCP